MHKTHPIMALIAKRGGFAFSSPHQPSPAEKGDRVAVDEEDARMPAQSRSPHPPRSSAPSPLGKAFGAPRHRKVFSIRRGERTAIKKSMKEILKKFLPQKNIK